MNVSPDLLTHFFFTAVFVFFIALINTALIIGYYELSKLENKKKLWNDIAFRKFHKILSRGDRKIAIDAPDGATQNFVKNMSLLLNTLSILVLIIVTLILLTAICLITIRNIT